MGQGILKDLGPCQVIFNETSLGETFGDVIFRYTSDSRPIYEDSKGTAQVDEVFVGAACEVEVPMTRTSLAQLSTIIPGATITNSTVMEVDSPVGTAMYDNAAALVLKPLVGGVAAAQTSWLTVPKAYPKIDLEVVYNNESQKVYKAIFVGFADANGLIWKVGA